MKKIESQKNEHFKKLKSLLTSKGIKKEGLCLVSGKYILPELETHKGQSLHHLESYEPDVLLSKDLFNELSPLKTSEPLWVMPTPQMEKANLESAPQGLEVLLPVGDPKNLGALIRTCLAFEVQKIILLEESAHPFLPQSIKASAGSVFKAPLFKGPSVQDLKGTCLYSLDKEGNPLKKMGLQNRNIRLLLGEEGGLPAGLEAQKISIPISDQVESLNVNSCLSIVLYELSAL